MTDDPDYEGYLADEPGELDRRAVWRAAEQYLCEKYDLIPEHGSWYDARTQDGEPVELKSCQARYADGRVGKFKLWLGQSLELGSRGLLALLVYVPEERYPVVVSRKVRQWVMTDANMHVVKHSAMGKFPEGKAYLLVHPWPSVIPVEELSSDLRVRFPVRWQYYDEDPDSESI